MHCNLYDGEFSIFRKRSIPIEIFILWINTIQKFLRSKNIRRRIKIPCIFNCKFNIPRLPRKKGRVGERGREGHRRRFVELEDDRKERMFPVENVVEGLEIDSLKDLSPSRMLHFSIPQFILESWVFKGHRSFPGWQRIPPSATTKKKWNGVFLALLFSYVR